MPVSPQSRTSVRLVTQFVSRSPSETSPNVQPGPSKGKVAVLRCGRRRTESVCDGGLRSVSPAKTPPLRPGFAEWRERLAILRRRVVSEALSVAPDLVVRCGWCAARDGQRVWRGRRGEIGEIDAARGFVGAGARRFRGAVASAVRCRPARLVSPSDGGCCDPWRSVDGLEEGRPSVSRSARFVGALRGRGGPDAGWPERATERPWRRTAADARARRSVLEHVALVRQPRAGHGRGRRASLRKCWLVWALGRP